MRNTVGIVDPSGYGWSQSGEMRTADSNAKVTMQASFPEPGNYTCQFGLQKIDTNYPGVIVCEAEIIWSVEGNFVRRVVSVGNGASIQGQAQGIKVTLSDHTPASVFDGKRYIASVQCTKGTRASYSHPPIYVPSDLLEIILIPATDSFQLAVPENCGIISAFVTLISPGNTLSPEEAYVEQQFGSGFQRIYSPLDTPGFIPLGPNVINLVLNNLSANQVVASVAWGIDG